MIPINNTSLPSETGSPQTGPTKAAATRRNLLTLSSPPPQRIKRKYFKSKVPQKRRNPKSKSPLYLSFLMNISNKKQCLYDKSNFHIEIT
jgi:hypothetical protein